MTETPDPFTNLYEHPAKLMRAMFAPMTGGMDVQGMVGEAAVTPEDAQELARNGAKLQALWAQ